MGSVYYLGGTPAENAADQLGAEWSPDFDAYAAGEVDAPRCVLCLQTPCACPEFGSDEYFALLGRRHGTGKRGTPLVTNRDATNKAVDQSPSAAPDPRESASTRGCVT